MGVNKITRQMGRSSLENRVVSNGILRDGSACISFERTSDYGPLDDFANDLADALEELLGTEVGVEEGDDGFPDLYVKARNCSEPWFVVGYDGDAVLIEPKVKQIGEYEVGDILRGYLENIKRSQS